MSDPGAIFGDVRSLMQGPAQAQTWRALTLALDGAKEEGLQQQLLPYLESALRRWPDELRLLPERWISAALSGQAPPWLSLGRSLKTRELNAQALQLVASHEGLAHLSALHLQGCELTPSGLAALMDGPAGRGLKTLYVAHSVLDDASVEALCAVEGLSRLKTLDLRYNRIRDDGAAAIARAPALTRLEHLDLRHNLIGLAGATALLEADMPALKTLALQDNRLGSQDLDELLKRPRLAQVGTLELLGFTRAPSVAADLLERDLSALCAQTPSALGWERLCKLLDRAPERMLSASLMAWLDGQLERWPDALRTPGEAWRRALLEHGPSARFGVLRELALEYADVRGYRALALAHHLGERGLRAIRLKGCALKDGDMLELIQSGLLRAADTIVLSDAHLRMTSLQPLLESPVASALKELDLSGNYMGNRGVAMLCQVPFGRLRTLRLGSVELGFDGALALAQCPQLASLETLDVQGNSSLTKRAHAVLNESPHLSEHVKAQWWWNHPWNLDKRLP